MSDFRETKVIQMLEVEQKCHHNPPFVQKFRVKNYGEFIESAEKIPTNILANRLKTMETEGIIEKIKYNERPLRFEYALTEKGQKFREVVKFLRDWGDENLADF